jgi:dTDP-4-amino-4,6-dideoxygalactose transaminase
MNLLQKLCKERDLFMIEDAAQALLSKYDGQHLGTFGDLSCLSFHATKNVISGEGGALLVNNEALIERAKVILEKGTNREKFIAGEVDKYSWVDIGSSFLMSEIAAAYLHAQLENAQIITETRLGYWNDYRLMLQNIKDELGLNWQNYSARVQHNAHINFLILPSEDFKKLFISKMREREVACVSHYVPLHSAEAGLKFGRVESQMTVTDNFSPRLVRLPMWSRGNMPVEQITNTVITVCREIGQI